MFKPLLSICIPTYNRAAYLEKTIQSIVIQPEFIERKVEIVISDNASSDNTEEVCRKYEKKYENFLYFKNEVNIRDKNFPLVLGYGNGLLRKLNNDTLMYDEGSIGIICKIIEKYKEVRNPIFFSNKKGEQVIRKLNFREFMKAISFNITYIGSFAIWEDDCDAIANDVENCDLLLWQVGKFLKLASQAKEIILFDYPFGNIQNVKKKNISYGLYQVFYKNYFHILQPYFDNKELLECDREFLERDLLYNFFLQWIVQWELQQTNLLYSETENLKKEVFDQYKNKGYWRDFYVRYTYQLCKMKIVNFIMHILGRKTY